jgi:hypothetical protein
MAEPKANIPVPAGLPDMSKINYADVTPDEAQNIQASTEKYLQDLENRYAQPNWWKVAAGFAKPQLGGFMASLGSATDALGENIEQQRAIAPTISMMRAQLAQQQPGIRQAQKSAQLAAGHKGPITPDYLRELDEMGDTQVARAAHATYASQQKDQELRDAQFTKAKSIADANLATGALDKAGYAKEISRIQSSYGSPNPNVALPSSKPLVEGAASSEGKQPAVPTNFGTPSTLLDNLRQTESSGNATALNKDTKAMGPYQFLPETTKMLHEQGIKFNPFDEQQSRAAADQYLQILNKKNNGDWNKTLADYGGFKTKDPSGYIAKITKGVDFTKPIASSVVNSAAPTSTYESAGATGPVASELTKEELSRRDTDFKGKISKIASATPDVTETRASDIGRAGTLLNDPSVQAAMAQRFKDPGFTTAFKEALAKGFTAAVAGGGAGWSANVSAPVDAVLTAYNVDPKVRAKLIELNRIAMRDSIADLREGTQALGGGHASTTEYQGLMNRVANTEEPYKLMQQWFATRAVQNQFDRDANSAYMDYLHQPKSGERPVSTFFQHPGYVNAIKNFGKNYRKAQTVAD